MYGFVLKAEPDAPRPSKTGPETGHFRVAIFANERPVASDTTSIEQCELQILSSWCTQIVSNVHRLGEPAADQLSRTPWTVYIRSPNPVAQLITPLTAVAKSCLCMHKLDNICSSSVYGFVLRFAPERSQMPHAPPKLVPKRAIFGYFFANERPVASSIRHRCLTVCYKYCLVDAPGVSNSTGEPAADQLRGHLEQCISDRHTQPCRAADLGWHLWLQWRTFACTN